MRHALVFACCAAVGVLAGCPDRSIDEVLPQQGRVEFKDIPITPNRNVDILFIIDDSRSMRDKQENLARNFRSFIDVLRTIEGGLPSVHLGVVTSDMGTKGADGMVSPPIGPIGNGGCQASGKDGVLQTSGAAVSGGPFISDIVQPNGTRTHNYGSADLADVFSTMARVGDTFCGFEQHLEAAKRALNNHPANAGFLRPEAYLALIFIADEDDCSMQTTTMLATDQNAINTLGPAQSFRCTRFGVICDQGGTTPDEMNEVGTKRQCHPNANSQYLTDVAAYATFFKQLKSSPNRVIVAGIMGTNEPFATELREPMPGSPAIPALAHSCEYTNAMGQKEVADPPIRLRSFLDQFPNRNTFAPICQADLTTGLQQIGDLLKTVIGNPCIEGKLADVDPMTPGAQYECSVSAVTETGAAVPEEKILPRCEPDSSSPSNASCWRLVPDQARCPNSDNLALTIVQNASEPFELDTRVIANCVTAVN